MARRTIGYQAAPTQPGLPNLQQQVHIGNQSIHIHHHHHSHGTTPDGSGQQMVSHTHPTRNHVHTRIRKPGDKTVYRCSECNGPGYRDRYVCQYCPYVQHINCKDFRQHATHPFFKGSTFKLHQQHSDGKRISCNACGLDIAKLFYHCERTNKIIHPFCLNNLPCSLTTGGRNYNLCRTITSKACSRCLSRRKDHKDNCWWYSSERQDTQYHVSCMMEIFRTPK